MVVTKMVRRRHRPKLGFAGNAEAWFNLTLGGGDGQCSWSIDTSKGSKATGKIIVPWSSSFWG
jgi:hypothetical protein